LLVVRVATVATTSKDGRRRGEPRRVGSILRDVIDIRPKQSTTRAERRACHFTTMFGFGGAAIPLPM